ncbi:DUF4184 family protein [Candidatus Entotheonella palauensis]|uniref:DUF4184 family protein n=1 Tax=Candidatus Entotheonella palauensis TaxID=93172 RepID=UPI0015C4C371|nr:DUF4184 family protein [Candidatus Entotheonella palauensis]
MPFTLAHPAAVIPLCRRLHYPGAMSALVIGSMAPDFVYWLPLPIYREMSHRIPALFTFCLPADFSLFLLYHILIKPPILALLPRAILMRLPQPQPIPWHLRHIILVLLAVLLGATTHITWDAFTHRDTLVTRLLPFLETPLWTGNGYVLYLYKLLQHASTLVGFGVLAIFVWRWYQRTPPRDNLGSSGLAAWQKAALATYLIVPSAIGAIRSGLHRAPWEASLIALQKFLISGAVTGIGIFTIVLITLGLLWPLIERREG